MSLKDLDVEKWLSEPMELPEWYDEVPAMFNHICLAYRSELVRLVGFAEGIDDYYYIVRKKGWKWNGDVEITEEYYTCVGHMESLKEYLPTEMYNAIENGFNLNNAPPAEEFILKKIR